MPTRRGGPRIIKQNARRAVRKRYITNARDIKRFQGRKQIVTNTRQIGQSLPGTLPGTGVSPDPAMIDYCRTSQGVNDPNCAIELTPSDFTGGNTLGEGGGGGDEGSQGDDGGAPRGGR